MAKNRARLLSSEKPLSSWMRLRLNPSNSMDLSNKELFGFTVALALLILGLSYEWRAHRASKAWWRDYHNDQFRTRKLHENDRRF